MERLEVNRYSSSNRKHHFIIALGIALIISLFVSFAGFGLTPSAYAEEAVSLTGSGQNVTFYESLDPVIVDANITLTGETFDGAKVSISQGFVSGSDELLFENQNGITGSYDAASGILSLSGTASAENYQTALRSVQFQNLNGSSYSSASQKTISFSIGESTLYNQDNGHFYEFVESPAITWTDAKIAAESRSYYGLKGYLTTITSSTENAFITQKLKGFGWIGASDAKTENTWKWVTGPEAGTAFTQISTSQHYHYSYWNGHYYVPVYHTHTSIDTFGQYNNWAGGEPNDYNGEDYAHFYSDGSWNDFPYYSGSIAGYVVEYGGTAGDPQISLTANSIVTLDAKPTVSDIADQTTNEDTSVTVAFTVNDDLTPLDSLVVTAASSNADATIQLNGTGSERNMVITPANNQSGTMSIELLVNDGHSEMKRTFNLNVIDTTKTLIIHGANGTPGDTDAHTEFSLDEGQTWNSAYLYGSHPWGFVPDTNSWLNCAASGGACLNMEVLYRVQFSVPDDATNAEMKFDIKADNYATISLNGTHVTDIVGENSIDLDASIASEVQPGLNTILINVRDEGGWAGLNYKITLSINAPTAPVLVDPAPTAEVNYSTIEPTNMDVVASITPSETVTITNNDGSASYTFSENGSFTFQFVDAAGNTGEAVATVSNIDKVAPLITVGSYTTAPTNQDVVVAATTNEGTLNAESHTFTENGEFTFTATDAAGNVTDEIVTITNIDRVAPVITVGSYSTDPTNQDVVVTVTTNEGTLNAASHTFTENGEFTFTATDAAGNVTNETVTITNIDKTPPVITIGSYTTAPTNQDIIVTVTTNEGTLDVASHTFSENGEFTFTATDAAGNVTNETVTITNIDKTPPVITVGNYNTEPTNQDVAVTVTTNEGTLNAASHTFTENGEFTFTATDAAGNVTNETVTITNIDKTPPVITVDAYTTAPTNQDVVVTVTTNEGTLNTASHTYTANGEFTFIATDAVGNVTNKTVTITNIDKVAPVTVASTGTEFNSNGWFNADVTVNLAATDNYSGVANTYFTVDGAEAQSGTSVIVSGEGNHVITYWSVDAAGNVEAIQTINVNIDITAPELTIAVGTSTLWSPNHKLVDITATVVADGGLSGLESIVLTSITSNELDYDPSSVDDDVANDIQGAAFGENDTSFQLRAERSGEGTGRVYTITYTVTDRAGNQTTATAVVEVPHDKGNNKEVPKGKKK